MQKQTKRYALIGTEIKEVDEKEIDYELDSPNKFFGSHTNLIPMQSTVAGPRVFYGSRFFNQAVPLTNPDAPLVQSLMDGKGDKTFEDYAGDNSGNIRSKVDGIIKSINDDTIVIVDKDNKEHLHDLYNNFSFNRKTFISNKPLVKVGDKVTSKQLVAHSNFTDANGQLALGKNARIGLIPYKGLSMDDAVVVSSDFANKLSSEQMLTYEQTKKGDAKLGLRHFTNLFPYKYSKEQLSRMDDGGVIKVGTTVNKDDPLILTTGPRIISSATQQLGRLSRHILASRKDNSKLWKYDAPGVVTDVAHTPSGVKLNVKVILPAQEGDKIVARSGQKGVISRILPQEHMPRTMDGQPLDMLLNPLGIPSRVNNSLIYELLLGKIAQKTGKPYKVEQFKDKDTPWYDYVSNELKKNGIEATESIYDPLDDKIIENPITVGSAQVLKLTHMAESKMSGRSFGAYSTTDDQPLKGGTDGAGAKRLSGLEHTALISSGAYNTLREVATLRGTRNDEYWRLVRMGQNPKAPGEPFAWDKFKMLIIGSGLHADPVTKDTLRLSPMTDKKLNNLKPVEVLNGSILNMKNLEPVSEGLFDLKLTTTNRWGKIPLDFPIPNPAFEKQITKLLDITRNDLLSILKGEKEINGETGPNALKNALAKIDMKAMASEAIQDIKGNKKTKRPLAVQRLTYIRGLEKHGITPDELMISSIPVIPPKFRPFSLMGETFIPGDANELYKDLIEIRDTYRDSKKVLGEQGASDNILDIYNAARATYGYGDPINTKTKERGVSGFLTTLVGKSPKFSWLNRKLLSKTTDLSGRSVITVNPELKLDEIGIPEDLAWKIFQPFIQRSLVQRGLTPAKAIIALRDKEPIAKQMLAHIVKTRPIMYSRAPVWHKFGVLGGWAKILDSKNIQINPLVTTALNADFDGDTINIHAPALDDTVTEIKQKLMPSKMLYTNRDEDNVMMLPKQETILGLYSAIRSKPKNTHTFPSKQLALEAIRAGKVNMSDEIIIN